MIDWPRDFLLRSVWLRYRGGADYRAASAQRIDVHGIMQSYSLRKTASAVEASMAAFTGFHARADATPGRSTACTHVDSGTCLTGASLVYSFMVMQPNGYGRMSPDRLNATFAALADPTRRAILARLASGEASVMALAEPFAMSQPAITKHLKVLERAGLVVRGRDAQRRPSRLEAGPLAEASEWLERYRQFWAGRFQQLDALLDELKAKDRRTPIKRTRKKS
jgi:DNA-binding transcriptional ArsR family regulator